MMSTTPRRPLQPRRPDGPRLVRGRQRDGRLDAIAGSSLLAPDAAGGGDTLAFNDAYDGRR